MGVNSHGTIYGWGSVSAEIITTYSPSVSSLLMKYRIGVFKYGPRRAQGIEVRTKTEVFVIFSFVIVFVMVLLYLVFLCCLHIRIYIYIYIKSLKIHEEKTKENHKRVGSICVIKIHVSLYVKKKLNVFGLPKINFQNFIAN